MKNLPQETKDLLRVVATEIEERNLNGRLSLWKGLSQVAGEETKVGQAARANVMVIEYAIKQQSDFLDQLSQEAGKDSK